MKMETAWKIIQKWAQQFPVQYFIINYETEHKCNMQGIEVIWRNDPNATKWRRRRRNTTVCVEIL